MGHRGEVYSGKIFTDKRKYFFNVKENRNGDLFLNIVESKKQQEAAFEDRQSVIIFEEDIDEFFREIEKAVTYIKNNKA
jgi:hypothetical protein